MGCSTSAILSRQMSKTSYNGNNPEVIMKELAAEDKNILKATWATLSDDMKGNGNKILLKVFELCDDLKVVMGCENLDATEMFSHPKFKTQSLRFMQVLGASVDYIEDFEKAMGPVLRELGKAHFSYQGFKKHHWNIFPEAVLFVWKQELGCAFTADVHRSWSSLLLLMITKLKEGYHQGFIEETQVKFNKVIPNYN